MTQTRKLIKLRQEFSQRLDELEPLQADAVNAVFNMFDRLDNVLKLAKEAQTPEEKIIVGVLLGREVEAANVKLDPVVKPLYDATEAFVNASNAIQAEIDNPTRDIVYLLDYERGLYKIGRTDRTMADRLSELQSRTSRNVSVICYERVDDNLVLETDLKRRFKPCQVYGELFELDDRQVDIAEQMIRGRGERT